MRIYILLALKIYAYFFNQPSKIDHDSKSGQTPKNVNGDIQFTNIDFKYPARMDVQILNNFNMRIRAGQTVALVGSSGCKYLFLKYFLQMAYCK